VHDFVGLGADGRSIHVPFRGRVADKNNTLDCLRVQIYCVHFALLLCTLVSLFLECDVYVFHGRREGTFSGTREQQIEEAIVTEDGEKLKITTKRHQEVLK